MYSEHTLNVMLLFYGFFLIDYCIQNDSKTLAHSNVWEGCLQLTQISQHQPLGIEM